MKKSELKNIIKECYREVLCERRGNKKGTPSTTTHVSSEKFKGTESQAKKALSAIKSKFPNIRFKSTKWENGILNIEYYGGQDLWYNKIAPTGASVGLEPIGMKK